MKLAIKKLVVIGAALAAPVLSAGCDCNKSATATCAPAASAAVVSASACSSPVAYAQSAAPITYRSATVGYPAASSVVYDSGVVYDASAALPAVSSGAVVYADETVVPARRGRRYHRGYPRHARGPMAVGAPAVVEAAYPATASGSAIYYTPGGTPVGMYVPGPAAAVVQSGPINNNVNQYYTGGQPVGASIHYTTGSKCNVQPQYGESVVWTSGF